MNDRKYYLIFQRIVKMNKTEDDEFNAQDMTELEAQNVRSKIVSLN